MRRFQLHRVLAIALLVGAFVATGGALASALVAPAPGSVGADSEGAPRAVGDGSLGLRVGVRIEALGASLAREMHLTPPVSPPVPVPGASRSVAANEAPVEMIPVDAEIALGLDEAAPRQTLEEGASAEVASVSATEAPRATEAFAIAAAVALALGALAWFWPSLKHVATRMLVAPLFAHVGRAEVFENGVRERIFGLVRDEAGISASELSAKSGVSWGTTIYHLDVLEQNQMVVSVKDGRYRRYFANGAGSAEKQIVSALRNPVSARVAEHVRNVPGLSQKDLASQTGLSPQALHWHANRLLKAGVVTKIRDGRVVRFFRSS